MVNPFEIAIKAMSERGFFQFLFPFMLSAAIFYGLLRKSQIFGPPERNVAVNGVVALVAAFMVWAYPIIAGIDITLQLSNFFIQGLSVSLIVMFGLMIAGMFFPPDLPKVLSEKFKGAGFWGVVIVAGILVGLIVFLSSGLMNIFFPQAVFGENFLSSDIFLTVISLVILAVFIVVIVGAGAASAPKAEKKEEGK